MCFYKRQEQTALLVSFEERDMVIDRLSMFAMLIYIKHKGFSSYWMYSFSNSVQTICSHTSTCRGAYCICWNILVARHYKCTYSYTSMCTDTSTHLHRNTRTQSVRHIFPAQRQDTSLTAINCIHTDMHSQA